MNAFAISFIPVWLLSPAETETLSHTHHMLNATSNTSQPR